MADDDWRVKIDFQRALTTEPHDFTATEPENPALAAYNARLAALAAADREATGSEQRLPS